MINLALMSNANKIMPSRRITHSFKAKTQSKLTLSAQSFFSDIWRVFNQPVNTWNKTWLLLKQVDRPFIIMGLILLILGLICLTSASAVLGEQKFENSYFYLWEQIISGLIPGIILAYLAFQISGEKWPQLAVPALIFSIGLLALVFIPGIGFDLKGAHRWVNLGLFSFQPTEIVKLTLIVYLSTWLSRLKSADEDWQQTILPFIIFMGIIASLVIAQPDIGTLGVIVAIGLGLYWIAGGRTSHVVGLIIFGFIGLIILTKIAPYRMARLEVFLRPDVDPQGIGYHLAQAVTAISHGGILGQGLGQSSQKYLRLPEVAGDSIFAVMAEEGGFILTSLYIVLLTAWLTRGWILTKNLAGNQEKLLASGILIWLSYQSFLNIAAISGIAPLTGIPLPFFSYGGTAYAINLTAVAIMLRLFSKPQALSLKRLT